MRALLTVSLLAGSTLTLGGCSGGDDGDGSEAVLLTVLPYTGKWEQKGLLHENAVRMALEELIAAGAQEALGSKISVIAVNSGDGIDVTEAAVRDIVEGPDGDKVLGILSSTGDAHEGSAVVALEHGIPHFETSNGAHDEEFVDWSQYSDEELGHLLSARALCNYEAVYTAQYIMNEFPNGKVVLVRGDEIHDKMHTAVVRQQLALLGFQGTVVESNDPNLAGETDPGNRQDFAVSYDALESGGVQAELEAIVSAHQPDVLFFHVRGDGPNLRFLQDAQRAGFQGGIVTCGMARTTALIDPNENGLISDYLVGNDVGLAGDRFHFVMRGAIASPRLDAFKADYLERFGIDADTFTTSVYDATTLMVLGLLGSPSRPFDRDEILAAIVASSKEGVEVSRDDLPALITAAAAGEDLDYQGTYSNMDIREDRTVEGYYYIERVVPVDGGGYTYEKLSDPAPVSF